MKREFKFPEENLDELESKRTNYAAFTGLNLMNVALLTFMIWKQKGFPVNIMLWILLVSNSAFIIGFKTYRMISKKN